MPTWVPVAAALAALALLSGCGGSSAARTPDLSRLPIVDGGRIVAQVKNCDKGASRYCAWQIVVVDPRYRSSIALVAAEHDRLHRLGWTGADAETGDEHAADSPGHALRVTYASADGELKDIDLGWIKRDRAIGLALSKTLFDRSSAMSIMLEPGSG